MIKFLGIGSAFNTALGNNSGIVKHGTAMLLIDCGGTVFDRLRIFNVLNDIETLHIIITHSHPDHIGSLGDLIFYCFYKLKVKPNIYFPENMLLKKYFSVVGVKDNMYTLGKNIKNTIKDKYLGDITLEFIPASHTNSIPAFGFFLTQNGRTIYYSGDSNRISSSVIEKLKTGEIEAIYQDTTSIDYVNTGHFPFTKLCEIIDKSLRNRVYCMHLDEEIVKEEILDEGFNIAPLIEE